MNYETNGDIMTVEIKGSGTKQDRYRISCADQLQAVNQDLSACYKLENHIDATKIEEFEPIGDTLKPFTGTFDGNNYEIRGLCIEKPAYMDVGLFACIGHEGRVKNLGLTDSSIEGSALVGTLVGVNYGTIESSYAVEVDVSGDYSVGGLVGKNYGGAVESSYIVRGDISGNKHIGSLVGRGDTDRYFENCFTLRNSDEPSIPEDVDLKVSRSNHTILYVVETNTLYIQVSSKICSCSKVPSFNIQHLVDEIDEVNITDKFRASLVKDI